MYSLEAISVYLIVVGCGRVGAQLANFLAAEGHDVVVIDKNHGAFRRLGGIFNGITIEGIGFDEDVLREAGVEKADALAAVTDLDNTNLMIAEVARQIFKVPKVVARLYNPEKEASYQQFELNYVCGTTLVAGKILDYVTKGRISHLVLGETEVTEFVIADSLAGRKVMDIEIPGELKTVAIKRGEQDLIPQPDTQFVLGDRLIVAAKKEPLRRLNRLARG
jgi:trk system potassium uptake protein TrkA